MAGGRFPARDGVGGADPCLAFDSFVTIGDAEASDIFAASPSGTGSLTFSDRIAGGWLVQDATGVAARQGGVIPGSDSFFLRVARLTAPTTVDGVSGTLSVTVSLGGAPCDGGR